MNPIVLAASILTAVAAQEQPSVGLVAATTERRAYTAKTPLERAIETARANGRLVLVIVVAPDVETRRSQSRWLADLLAAGGDELLVDLALVEIAFATQAQLYEAARLPQPAWNADSIGLLEFFGDRPAWTPIRLRYGPWYDSCGSSASKLAERMRMSAEQLREALLGDKDLVERQLARVRAALEPRELAAVEARLESGECLSWQPIVRDAWLFRESILQLRPGWHRWLNLLRMAGGERVLHGLHGARWFVRGEHGVEVQFTAEDDELERARFTARAELEGVADGALERTWSYSNACAYGPCGTGSTSVVSHRFLDGYVRGLVLTPDEE